MSLSIKNIPSDWELKKLGDYLDYIQPTKYITNNINKTGNIPVLTANKAFVLGYTDESENIFTNIPVIIFDDFTTDSKFVDFNFKVRSSALKILVPKTKDINIHYLYESLKSINYQCVEHKRYWISEYQYLKIPVPPLKEQQKIAEILSTVDAKISIIDEQISENQNLKKGLMQSLLSKGIGHTEFKKSALGEIPKSWEVVKMGEISIKIGDGLHSTPKYVDNSNYYFVNGNNLINGKLIISEKTKCVSFEEFEKHNKNIEISSILISINGTIGNLAFYNGESVVFGKSACYISPDLSKINKYFLYYYFQTYRIKKYFANEVTGTTIKNLSLKTIRNTPIPLPPLQEQEKIASILSSVDEKLGVLSEKKSDYQNLKKGLMQQLLTGLVRVSV
ncbi:restriction endonuclease subunit S [Tenacibaculum finnmarkense]|uniref:restriction endonuclease subunit S n=1 Tax=Tenacibaculum finnmarkense TaxID=2781243 RepID=UPI003BB49DFC